MKQDADRYSWFIPISVVFVLLKVVTWLLTLPITADGDSPSYLPGPSLDVQTGWYVGLEKVSLTGDSSMRPWPATLLFGVLPTMLLRSGAQMLLSTASFIVLALILSLFLRSFATRIVAVVGVFTLGLTPMVSVWESHLWRESLSVTAVVFLFSCALYFVKRPTWPAVVGFIASSLALVLLRFTYFPIVVIACGAMMIGYWLQRSQGQPKVRAWVLVIASIAVLIYGYTYFSAQDRGWIPWYGQSISEAQFGYIHSASNPGIPILMSDLAGEYPTCVEQLLPVEAEYPSKHFYFVLDNVEACPELRSFIRSGEWSSHYTQFLATSPVYVIKVLKNVLPVTLGWTVEMSETSFVPEALASFVVPTRSGWGAFEPLVAWLMAGGVVVVFAFRGLRARGSTRGAERSWLSLVIVAYSLVVASGLSMVLGTLLTPTADADPYRISIAALALLRLGAIVGLLFGLDEVLRLRRDFLLSRTDQGTQST